MSQFGGPEGSSNRFKLTIIVVNWNSGDYLRHCLDSLGRSRGIQLGEIEVIVVDNGSLDGSARDLNVMGPVVKVLWNKTNRGFGAACNQAAAVAGGEYLLFLNPDTVLEEDTLFTALAFMDRQGCHSVGVCGVQLTDRSGGVAKSCARFPRPLNWVAHSFGLTRFSRRLDFIMMDWDHKETRVVDHVIGAFFLIRRGVFWSVGGFDERFFLYLEDLDLSLRLRQAGYSAVFLAEARAFHEGGGTSSTVKATRLYYSLHSRLQYAFKHFTALGALIVLLSTLLVEPCTRIVLALARASWADAVNTIRGYLMLARELPRTLTAMGSER